MNLRENIQTTAAPGFKENINPWRLFFMTTLLLVFIMTVRIPVDSDTWWHLRAGEITWSTGQPLLKDTLSFTHFNETWINHSWLSQVVLFLCYKLSGYWVISIRVALIAAMTFGLLFRIGKSPAPFRSLLAILGVVVSAPVWSPRPQIFSLFFLALVEVIFHLYQIEHKRILWILPLVFTLWANFHAGFTLGLIYLICAIAGELINVLMGNSSFDKKEIRSLIGWTVASSLSVMINPNGIGIWKVQFNTLGSEALQQQLVEWASPNFHELSQTPFLLLLIILFFVLAFSRKKLDSVFAVQVGFFSGMALLARRNIGPCTLVLIPVLDLYGWGVARSFGEGIAERIHLHQKTKSALVMDSPRNRLEVKASRIINFLIIGLLTSAAVIKTFYVGFPAVVEAVIQEQYPAEAVRAMKATGIKGNILNEYNWGGYLDWSSKSTLVYIDGRTDLYGDKTFEEWSNLVQAGNGWEDLMDRYNIQGVLLKPDRPILSRLSERGWSTIFSNQQAILMVKTR